MKKVSNWAIGAVLLVGIGFVVLNREFPTSAHAQSSSQSCSDATLHGLYVFGATGYSGRSNTPFAFAGNEFYNGNGTDSGVVTMTTAGQVSTMTFTGTYHVISNCTATETDTFHDGTVATFNDYTGPTGNTATVIETDKTAVAANFEIRVSGGQNQQ